MLKKFNPILEEEPIVFYDDLYLADKSGNVLACRQGSDRKINNIFDLLSNSELDFVRNNLLLLNFYPLLLVDSSEGVMILDFSLFISKRVFVAIIPRLSECEVLSVCKNEFSSKIFTSPNMKERFETAAILESDEKQIAFCQNLELYCRANAFYRVHGRTNVELADIMIDISHDICKFIGCKIDFEVRGISIFELKNELCLDSFRSMLITLCLTIRKYADNRCGTAVIHFDDIGISLEVYFDVAEDYLYAALPTIAPELTFFENSYQMNGFSLICEQNGRVFNALGYLWQKQGDFEHVKKDIAKLTYTNE